MMSRALLSEIAGWYGMIAIILAYIFVSFGVISSESVAYQVLNFTGAVGVIVISVHKKVRQSAILNIFWGMIALVALANILLQ